MTKTLKIYLKLGILLFGIPLLLTTCEKDTLLESSQTEIEVKSQYKVKRVKLSQIPKVRDFLIGKTNTNLFSRTTINGAIFDDDNILEVIDTLSNANYTFRFTYPDTPLGEFYNLIVGKTPEGENKTPYVLKYVCDDVYLDNYMENNFDFHFFKGTISRHKYTDFFDQGSIFGKTTSIYTTDTDTNCPPEYDENVTQAPKEEKAEAGEIEFDERYDDAVALVTKSGQASISMVQRHMRIGYNRAARIIETMEQEGIVGPSDGAKPREVLVRGYDDM